MNLQVIRKSRHKPTTGDVFALQIPQGAYLFGRVVATDASPLGVGLGILIYVYNYQSASKAEVPPLKREELLVSPIITNAQLWTEGFFEHIRNVQLSSFERYQVHAFRDSYGRLLNEKGEELREPSTAPVGTWGLHSYRTIDDEISRALGIPLAKD